MLLGGGAKFLLEKLLVVISIICCFCQYIQRCPKSELVGKTNARKNGPALNQDTNKNEREAEFIKEQ